MSPTNRQGFHSQIAKTYSCLYLYIVGECDTDNEQFVDNPQQFCGGQHAVFQAAVQEIPMESKDLIHIWNLGLERKENSQFKMNIRRRRIFLLKNIWN